MMLDGQSVVARLPSQLHGAKQTNLGLALAHNDAASEKRVRSTPDDVL
jgi:hypothetical protein